MEIQFAFNQFEEFDGYEAKVGLDGKREIQRGRKKGTTWMKKDTVYSVFPAGRIFLVVGCCAVVRLGDDFEDPRDEKRNSAENQRSGKALERIPSPPAWFVHDFQSSDLRSAAFSFLRSSSCPRSFILLPLVRDVTADRFWFSFG